MTDDPIAARTLDVLRRVAGGEDAVASLDVPLFASGLLDSLAVVSLMAAFEETFGLVVSPASLDREAWATPRAMIADVRRRLAMRGAA